jgi:hypothetical protein
MTGANMAPALLAWSYQTSGARTPIPRSEQVLAMRGPRTQRPLRIWHAMQQLADPDDDVLEIAQASVRRLSRDNSD